MFSSAQLPAVSGCAAGARLGSVRGKQAAADAALNPAARMARIAILGTRGIPARYGGFETFAEELSTRLAARGHQVMVYCRERHSEKTYRGVRLVYLPTWRHKYFDTIVHTFFSTLHLIVHRTDVALYCNGANAIFTLLPRLTGVPTALNVDGLERKRKKWNRLAKAWYAISEWLATFCPSAVVTDARKIAEYYLERYGKHTEFIPYGAETGKVATAEVLSELGLEASGYFLYVSRMEPENNALAVREAFEKVGGLARLALIGDAPYAQEYIQKVRATRDPRVDMPGAIYGAGYHELLSNCLAYIHATEVGGTHPALIEAMGRGALVLYLNTPENAEVAEGAGIAFEFADLAQKLGEVLVMSSQERAEWGRRAAERVAERYGWEAVTDQYETLLVGLLSKK
jgi:glycosyltransferase involved in cell wall biosynthesis